MCGGAVVDPATREVRGLGTSSREVGAGAEGPSFGAEQDGTTIGIGIEVLEGSCQFTDHAVTQMVVGRATHLDDAHETMTLNPDLGHRWVPHFPGPASRPTVASARCASAVIEQ